MTVLPTYPLRKDELRSLLQSSAQHTTSTLSERARRGRHFPPIYAQQLDRLGNGLSLGGAGGDGVVIQMLPDIIGNPEVQCFSIAAHRCRRV